MMDPQMMMQMMQMMQGLQGAQGGQKKGLTFGSAVTPSPSASPGAYTPAPTPNGMGEIINWKDAGANQLQAAGMPKAAGMGNAPVNALGGFGGDEGVDMGYKVAERGGSPMEAFQQEGFGSGMSAMGSNPGMGAAAGMLASSLASSGDDKGAQMLNAVMPSPSGGGLAGDDSGRMAAAQQMMQQLMQRRGGGGSRGLSLTGMR